MAAKRKLPGGKSSNGRAKVTAISHQGRRLLVGKMTDNFPLLTNLRGDILALQVVV
ncbi:MAG: hypothetical protein IMHGJWDQ_000642 [Candidatus Fervidibacter sp.]